LLPEPRAALGMRQRVAEQRALLVRGDGHQAIASVPVLLAMAMTESAIVKSALGQYLDGTGDATLLLRRIDRLGRALARNQRDLEVLSHAFGVFTRLWLAHTPRDPEEAKPSARVDAESRYRQFLEHVPEEFARLAPRTSRSWPDQSAAVERGPRTREGSLRPPSPRGSPWSTRPRCSG
jgi:hypothetical protein